MSESKVISPIWRPSPNFSQRTETIKHIILHGTWMADDNSALERMCSPKAEVSAHYFINREGQLFQMVEEENVAWHAGKSAWKNLIGLNQHSIGIEISNPGEGLGVPYFDVQYNTLIALLADILQRYSLPPEAVVGHSHIAPKRKTDPGKHFNWDILKNAGVAEPEVFCIK